MDPLGPGREVGKYRIVRRLATGGMAEIYLAQARGIQGFEKYVVLKRILPQYAESETFVKLFLNEARVAATLDHPNIATVYDIGETDGMYFFTMEYLHGEDLGHLLRELVKRGERIPLEHALTIGAGVAAGLHAAHEKRGPDGRPLGIVHRDVSPSNVVVTYDGGVKLVDFGVAKITANAELTKTGSVKGKLAYMSPEQCGNGAIDRRSDIFSLGVLLYELTTQTRLFKADSEAATLRMVLEARVPSPSTRVPGYPPELEQIIMKALARERDDRFASTREIQIALEQVARGRGMLTSTASLGEWMVNTLGAKTEPWLLSTMEFETLAKQADTDTSLKAIQQQIFRHSQQMAQVQMGPSLPTLVTGPALPMGVNPVRGRRRRRALLGALVGSIATVILAVAGFGAWTLTSRSAATATGGPVYIVQEKGQVAVERPAPTPIQPEPTTIRPLGQADEKPTTTVRPPPERKPRIPRARPAEPRVDSFSAAFARKEGELSRCFREHPEDGAQAPQIYVRFQAGVDGVVTSAEVLPPEVERTPLGKCVARVAASTRFGPQPEPVAFRIPVTVKRISNNR